MKTHVVFVLGAGFTRAFVPAAPLLVDDYDINGLRKRFSAFSHATAILNDAIAAGSDNRIDLERLMTRLTGMPYDRTDARHELSLLESDLRKSLIRRLNDAKSAGVEWDALRSFARFVIRRRASIVTFNYDDVLDQALREVHPVTTLQETEPYWHPDGGYGFFCRPSSVCVTDTLIHMDRPSSFLFKLHGSVNWRARLGEGIRRGPSALLHHEDWLPNDTFVQHELGQIEPYLEPDPFIVPPVLVKSELSLHPVLQVVWDAAYKKLKEADSVVFIGYSLPATDLAARTLFRETLGKRPGLDVQVVNYTPDGSPDSGLKDAYRSLFTGLEDQRFDFAGARARIERDFSETIESTDAAAPQS